MKKRKKEKNLIHGEKKEESKKDKRIIARALETRRQFDLETKVDLDLLPILVTYSLSHLVCVSH